MIFIMIQGNLLDNTEGTPIIFIVVLRIMQWRQIFLIMDQLWLRCAENLPRNLKKLVSKPENYYLVNILKLQIWQK